MSKTDELLAQLNKESQYNPLNEAFDLNSIADRFLRLKGELLRSGGLSNAVLTTDEMITVRKVRTITLNNDFRVVTYPNIHYDKKYKVDATVLFDFILNKINAHAHSKSEHFDVTATVQEGISYTLRYLTGHTPSKQITLDEFKHEYQLYVFGSYRKIQMFPKVLQLTSLAQKTPFIISYIDNKLIYDQVKHLNEYARRVENDFAKLLKSNEDLKYTLSSYMSCIERSIRALMNMYKIIRNTFVELKREYFNIFNQIIRVHDSDIGGLYHECCVRTNDFVKLINDNIENFGTLNESVDNTQSLFKTMGIEFISMTEDKINISRRVRDYVYKNIGLVSKVNCSDKLFLTIPSGLYNRNTINTKQFIDSIDDDILHSKTLDDLVLRSSEILYRSTKDDIKDINALRYQLTKDIIGETKSIEISLDEITTNVLELLSIVEYIDDNYYRKVIKNASNKLQLDNRLENCMFFKNIILGSLIIVDAIYFNILDLLQNFTNLLLYKYKEEL